MNASIYKEEEINTIIENLQNLEDQLSCVTTIDEARGLVGDLQDTIMSLEEDCYDFNDVMMDLQSEINYDLKNTFFDFDI